MEAHEFSFKAMGSPCKLLLYADSKESAAAMVAVATQEVQRLEERYSRYRPDSIVTKINAAAATGGSVTVDQETAELIDYAFTCYEVSDGLFDITSGLLRQVWNFSIPRLPDQSEIDNLLPRIGLDKIEWRNPALSFKVAGMEIDLGGIVKEYAADCVASKMKLNDGVAGIVDLGSDLCMFGSKPNGKPWLIGIRQPRRNRALLGIIEVGAGAVASSSDDERFFEIEGKRYCHLLNPHTGRPISSAIAGISVVAEGCLFAGSLSTIAMLKGDEGPAWLASRNARYVWMDDNGGYGGNLTLTP